MSEIISGRRRVHAYSVLERLADGLQVSRGWVGLAFDDESHLIRQTAAPAVDLSRPTARYSKESRTARRRTKALLADRPGPSRVELRDSMRA